MTATLDEDVVAGPGGLAANVRVDEPAWTADDPAAIVRRVLAALAERAPEGASVDVLFADDVALADLNIRYRGKTGPTNVLAFPSGERGAAPFLGGVAIAHGVCAREAGERGIPLSHHATHLTLHGLLHLLGYDHEEAAQQAAMEAVEIEVLAGLGIADPYGGE